MPNILRNAVQLAAQKFEEYHNIHMSKSIPDISKALANAKLARTMREALIQSPEISYSEMSEDDVDEEIRLEQMSSKEIK